MKKQLIIIAVPLLIFYSCSKSKTPNVTPGQTGGVTTYVGNGTAGLVNASGTGAELNLPVDVAVDISGNLYISEKGNNVIRKVAPGGSVITFAGDGTAGYKEGTGTAAEFNGPEGLILDDVGNLYVSDSQNNVIRRITPAGVVSTYAGNGSLGHVDGSATTAEFAEPNGLAIDKARNIYVADFFNNVIRKISATGAVTTYAGSGLAGKVDGPAASASFHNPSGITIDGSGNLYVAEASNNDVREIMPGGQVSTFATVTIDGSGNLYASCNNNTIQKIASDGTVSTYAGDGVPGYSDTSLLLSEFNAPAGVISNSQGVLIVADYNNNRIRVVTP